MPPPCALPGRSTGEPTAVPVVAEPRDRVTVTVLPGERTEIAVAIPGRAGPWGVLLVVGEDAAAPQSIELDRLAAVADAIGPIIGVARREEEVAHLVHRAEALRRVASDIGSRLDLDRILAGLVDHAMVLFEGDRAAVFLRRDGVDHAAASRGLSPEYLTAMRAIQARSLPAAAIAARRPLFAVAYRDDPRGVDSRAAVVQEGYDTICTAPLMDGTELLGMLNVYHDTPHAWTDDELDSIAALATQASVAIRAAQNFQQMATWTAQLQSIQQLGRPPQPPVDRARDRSGHRHRAAPDHRLPQRPGVSAGRAPTSSRSPCRARSASTSTRRRTSCGSPWARASPAGSPSIASPRTCPTPPPTRGPTPSRAPRTTSTSRCSWPRCSSRSRSSASSSCPSSASTSSATTTCG